MQSVDHMPCTLRDDGTANRHRPGTQGTHDLHNRTGATWTRTQTLVRHGTQIFDGLERERIIAHGWRGGVGLSLICLDTPDPVELTGAAIAGAINKSRLPGTDHVMCVSYLLHTATHVVGVRLR
jgi:hypothetical protein